MKIRNGFVSNSSSSSFVVAFNPNYNMEKGKKVDKCGDSPFNEIIEMYGQKGNIYNSADDLIRFWCECDGFEYSSADDVRYLEMGNFDKGQKVRSVKDQLPRTWKWAEVVHPDGTASRIGGIIDGMKDVDLTAKNDDNCPNTLDDYDADNGYMILVEKGE